MEIKTSIENGVATITPQGSINSVTADELDAAIQAIGSDSATAVEFDFAGVDYISSKCLRVLVATHRRLQDKSIKIKNANTAVADILKMSGLADIFLE